MNHGNGRHQAERTGKRIAYRLSLVLNIVLVVGILAFGAVKVAQKIMAMGGGGCDYHSNHYYYYYDFTSQYDQAVRIDKADICFRRRQLDATRALERVLSWSHCHQ